MAPAPKPRRRDGYTHELTTLVRSACLSVAATLTAFSDGLCVVGGLVPTLLADIAPATADRAHPGTLDLDLALSIALLDGRRYTAHSRRLRQEGFEPDENEQGNRTLQRWRHIERSVTVDFLIAPLAGAHVGGRVQPLEHEFGAVITPGLELAFDERLTIALRGRTLKGEHAIRAVPVCGPGAFVVLKALAFADRAEPKDAFDQSLPAARSAAVRRRPDCARAAPSATILA